MKTRSTLNMMGMLASLLLLSLLLGVGCGKKGGGFSAGENPAPETPVTPPVTPRDTDGPRGADFAAGATAPLEIESMAALTAYVAIHPLNSPKDVRISVRTAVTGTNQYAGHVYISYYDNGQYYTAHFETKDAQNPGGGTASAGNLYPNHRHSYYNNWFTWDGKPAFHGFFEDPYGAILLIIDGAVDQGDGSGAVEVSGSIWFKNFANTQMKPNTQSIPCWFITTGPYDCRTFLMAGGAAGDGNVVSASALYPTQSKWYTSKSSHPYIPEEPARGWKKLGSFSGLNKAKAFSQ